MSSPRFLADRSLRLILFGGKGGVGKTSCAAAAALRLAGEEPQRVLALVSTDPAHSLYDSLGDLAPPRNLKVIELQAQEHLDAFKRAHGAKLREIASRGTFLDDEDIARFMDLSLPGMDELFAFLAIARWVEERPEYDRIIVDTAPTGHTLRLLDMPELLERWVGALDTLLAKHRYMRQLFSRAYRSDALDAFLAELSGSVEAMRALLQDGSRCRFVPVMVAEELSVRETAGLLDELQRLGISAGEIVVNRMSPPDGCAVCAGIHAQQTRELARLPPQFAGRSLWGVPLFSYEVRGAKCLATFWDTAREVERSQPSDRQAEPPRAVVIPGLAEPSRAVVIPGLAEPPRAALIPRLPQVESPAPLPASSLVLLIFAGKGGVGKTTLACASALRLAHDYPEKKVLLFSTDPAHSLSDCLDQPVGARVTTVLGSLDALEIDPQSELSSLKQQYQAELDQFLRTVLGNLDLTFDRPVMERILDLSPPGLDEIMALTRAMDLLAGGDYDLLVVDAAPTGHLIRFLEMPAIIDQWLKAFFELFLKYRSIFRVPSVAERLVGMSRRLRHFRKLLRDPMRSELQVVSILTDMALEETKDLVAACERLGISAPVAFLNLATPESECPFCRERVRLETTVAGRFREALPGMQQAKVYWQSEPRGIARLAALGDVIYRSRREREQQE